MDSLQKAKQLDQFFTNKGVAEECVRLANEFIEKENIAFDLWLEPSAGSGSFFHLLPLGKRVGVDIQSRHNDILEADFLNFNLPNKLYFTIGNPPFGKNSSLAIKFFNKAATVSAAIAFIVPKTFKKMSVVKKLAPFFHLKFEYDIPKNSFHIEGEEYDVPCVFQIWVKSDVERNDVSEHATNKEFSFVGKEDSPDFALQRVGVHAGDIKFNIQDVSESSHLFIKCVNKEVIDVFKTIDWSSVKYNTAGNPSISQAEIFDLFAKQKENFLVFVDDFYVLSNGEKLSVGLYHFNGRVVYDMNKESLVQFKDEFFQIKFKDGYFNCKNEKIYSKIARVLKEFKTGA